LKTARGGIAGFRTVALQKANLSSKSAKAGRPDASSNWLDRRFGPTANRESWHAADARTMIADAIHGFSGGLSDK